MGIRPAMKVERSPTWQNTLLNERYFRHHGEASHSLTDRQNCGSEHSGIAPLAHPLETTQRCAVNQVTETNHARRLSPCPATDEGLYLCQVG